MRVRSLWKPCARAHAHCLEGTLTTGLLIRFLIFVEVKVCLLPFILLNIRQIIFFTKFPELLVHFILLITYERSSTVQNRRGAVLAA